MSVNKTINLACQDEEVVQLSNPHYKVLFSANGISVTPRKNELNWQWSLHNINAQIPSAVVPKLHETIEKKYVDYSRGNITERYLFHGQHIEQLFLIHHLPKTEGLCIEGSIMTSGHFETTPSSWQWKNDVGAVRLGKLFVYDALGKPVPAEFEVQADYTSIYIAQNDLETAVFPVTIDPEIGTNDFRISDMGTNGNTTYEALGASVAYNSTDNEYLVVWYADDNTGLLVEDEYEIYGQRLSATGIEIGANDFRISDMGTDGNASFDGINPSVTYNSVDNEYLVVWSGDDNIAPLTEGNVEIFGQLLNNTGAGIGGNDFRISSLGPEGSVNYFCSNPAVVHNASDNEYLVVWEGEDNTAPLVNDEKEIFGQRLSNIGLEVGNNDFRISDMGPDSNKNYDALSPAIAYNLTDNEYLVVWEGNDNTPPLIFSEKEIFGQRLSNIGNEIGDNDFRISDMGPNGNGTYDAFEPSIAYNSTDNEYMVIWRGDDNTAPLVNNENEIFGQRLSSIAVEIGSNDFRISDMGVNGSGFYDAFGCSIAYNSTSNEYFVVWRGDDDTAPLVNDEMEIFGQHLSSAGIETGINDFRISDMGPNGNSVYGGFSPFVIGNTFSNEYLVVWFGDDNITPLAEGENEIFGQRINVTALPLEWISFTVEKGENVAALHWQTIDEIDNWGFEIQRSLNGYSFTKIGWKDAQVYTNNLKDYFFEDASVKKGTSYYYRLKQIDNNGMFSYSKIKTIDFPSENNISIYPNPFQNEIFIESFDISLPFQLTIYNHLGQLVHSETKQTGQKSIQTEHLANGLYEIIFCKEGQIFFHEKMIKSSQ